MRRVLVIGDVMLDHYIEGDASRLSAEAPVPVISVERDRFVLGGAANVAANIVTLGGQAVLLGTVGDDWAGREVKTLVQQADIDGSFILTDGDRQTTEKCRIMSGWHQVARYDREDLLPLSATLVGKCVVAMEALRGKVDAVVVSDYAKGMITADVLNIGRYFEDLPIVVDPKQPGYESYCPVGAVIKPNRLEAEREASMKIGDEASALVAAQRLKMRLRAHAVYVTLGEVGGALCAEGGIHKIIPGETVAVSDPTGAGDAVAAALALSLGSGVPVEEAAYWANHVASRAVTMPGTAVVRMGTPAQLLDRNLP